MSSGDRKSEPSPEARETTGAERTGEILARVLEGLGIRAELERRQVIDHWSAAVGPDAATHSRAVGLRGDTLMVEVDHPVWMQELKFMDREIVGKLAKISGQENIRGIRFSLHRKREGDGSS